MKRRIPGALAALALLAPANALSTDEANRKVAAFVGASGYEAFDVDAIHDAGSPYEKMFPQSGQTATFADAMTGPVEKALLLVDAYETQKPDRMRYQVGYSQIVEDADGEQQVIMLVEVRRYNLGPLIRKSAIEEYGAENTAGPEAFGVGPDVAWRFAFSTVQGNMALALSASRHVIADGAAQLNETDAGEACLSGPCRALADRAIDHAPPREATDAAPIDAKTLIAPYTITFGSGDMIGENAAFIARNLQTFVGLEEGGDWKTPETPEAGEAGEPFLLMQIDQNLGQDIFSEGTAAYLRLNDDAVKDIYVNALFWNGQPPSEPVKRTVNR